MAEIIQGSDEWFAMRVGKVTASRISDIMAKGRNGEKSATREKYKAELICERLTGTKTEGFTTQSMADGVERESVARSLYEAKFGVFVDEVAFVDHPTIPMSGASPDGIVAEDGLIEIKSPQAQAHLKHFKDGAPSNYLYQMYWQMACTGKKWCDFVSYQPYFPDYLQLVVKRYHRDDEEIQRIESEVMKFLSEVNEEVNKLEKVKQ